MTFPSEGTPPYDENRIRQAWRKQDFARCFSELAQYRLKDCYYIIQPLLDRTLDSRESLKKPKRDALRIGLKGLAGRNDVMAPQDWERVAAYLQQALKTLHVPQTIAPAPRHRAGTPRRPATTYGRATASPQLVDQNICA